MEKVLNINHSGKSFTACIKSKGKTIKKKKIIFSKNDFA